MKFLKTAAALAALALTAVAGRAQSLDHLMVGFAQSGAANDVIIDFGNVNNYTAPGTYTLGNYSSILSANFTNWNTATGLTTVQFGATAAGLVNGPIGKANPVYLTSSWDVTTNSSTAWSAQSASQINGSRVNIGKVDTGYGTFTTVGDARAKTNSGINAWSTNVQPVGTTAFGFFSSPQFNTGVSELASNGTANFAAADLYSVAWGVPGAGLQVSLLGTLKVFQDGNLSFEVAAIPEPSTYAALLGVVTLGVVAIRRRRQAALEIA